MVCRKISSDLSRDIILKVNQGQYYFYINWTPILSLKVNAGKQSRVWAREVWNGNRLVKPFSVMDKLLGRKCLVQQNPSQQTIVGLHLEQNRKGVFFQIFLES